MFELMDAYGQSAVIKVIGVTLSCRGAASGYWTARRTGTHHVEARHPVRHGDAVDAPAPRK